MKMQTKRMRDVFQLAGQERAGSDSFPVMSITMHNGLIDQADKFKKRIASKDTFNYKVVCKNELVVGFPIDEGVIGFQTKYKQAIVSPAYDIWKIKDDISCNIDFVGRYLRSNIARRIYASKMRGAVARRRSIKKDDFLSIQIPFPPLDDQIRIAAVLTRAEKLIAKRKESIKALDELLKSTFLEMFGDPVRNEKGWETLPMHKVGSYVSGGTPSKERDDFWTGNFPWISPKDMKVPYISDSQDYISSRVFEETSLKKITPGHLLIVVRGMILAHSFPTAINKVPVSINQDMKAIQPIEKISVHYLKNCLDNMKRQILVIITTAGHGTKKLDTDAMGKVLIPVPPLPLQNQFAAIVEKVETLKAKYTQSLTELENLYASLSQRAFKGELDLSKVSVERIK